MSTRKQAIQGMNSKGTFGVLIEAKRSDEVHSSDPAMMALGSPKIHKLLVEHS